MKALKFLSLQHVKTALPQLSEESEVLTVTKEVAGIFASEAYVAGFRKAREMSADMMADLNNPQMALLINAMATVDVGENGERDIDG